MQADRWSSTAWFVALAIDIALCVYFAVSVIANAPRPPPGPPHAELPLDGETRCGRPYLKRMLIAVDSLELEMWSLVEQQRTTVNPHELRAMQVRLDDVNDRLQRIQVAYLDCDERKRLQGRPSGVKWSCHGSYRDCY